MNHNQAAGRLLGRLPLGSPKGEMSGSERVKSTLLDTDANIFTKMRGFTYWVNIAKFLNSYLSEFISACIAVFRFKRSTPASGAGYTISTIAPAGTRSNNSSMSAFLKRTQPWLAGVPMRSSRFVPWK
jgi:hypothetical protein